ncbi:Hypothetical predicted protein [Cloeon dipterum]|uniref:Uncharacterized protein n=1 Tax=Cloeon dipterum TaxID=197152 RepID=A0A8S1E5U9_9INSE|nr:Hypothetical predicted protein [Cloeon dipterum]
MQQPSDTGTSESEASECATKIQLVLDPAKLNQPLQNETALNENNNDDTNFYGLDCLLGAADVILYVIVLMFCIMIWAASLLKKNDE